MSKASPASRRARGPTANDVREFWGWKPELPEPPAQIGPKDIEVDSGPGVWTHAEIYIEASLADADGGLHSPSNANGLRIRCSAASAVRLRRLGFAAAEFVVRPARQRADVLLAQRAENERVLAEIAAHHEARLKAARDAGMGTLEDLDAERAARLARAATRSAKKRRRAEPGRTKRAAGRGGRS